MDYADMADSLRAIAPSLPLIAPLAFEREPLNADAVTPFPEGPTASRGFTASAPSINRSTE